MIDYIVPAPLNKSQHRYAFLICWKDEDTGYLSRAVREAIEKNDALYREAEEARETAIDAFKAAKPRSPIPKSLRTRTPVPPKLATMYEAFKVKVRAARLRKEQEDKETARKEVIGQHISSGLKSSYARKRALARQKIEQAVILGQKIIGAGE